MRMCERCARTQQTCCEKATVRLTHGDIERIGQYFPVPDFSQNADTSAWEADTADPLFSAAFVRRDCPVVRRTSRGCFFLSDNGCVLALGVRPLICRLYPMSYCERGLEGPIAPGNGYCPPPSGPEVLAELEMADQDQLRAWHRQLYEELRADYRGGCDDGPRRGRPRAA